MSFNDPIQYNKNDSVNVTMIHYTPMTTPFNNIPMRLQIVAEANFTSMFGKFSPIKTGLLPANCYRHRIKRQIFALWPRDEYNQAFQNNIY